MVSTVSVDGPQPAQVRVIPLCRCLSLRDECELYGPIVDKLHFDVVREVHAGDVVEPRVYESPAAAGGEAMRKPLPFGMVIEGGRHELITWDRVTGALQVTDIVANGQMLVEIPPDRAIWSCITGSAR